MGKKQLFNVRTFFNMVKKNDSLKISFSSYSEPSILSSSELTSPFLMILPDSNSHFSKFPFRHLWQEQILSFSIIQQSGKKAIMCNFLHCKFLNSSLGCFLISARWSSETTLYTQFGLSRCFCSKCSFTCSTWLKKKIFCDDTFWGRPFYPETAHRINQPFAVSWNTIIQNYSLIVLFG